MVAVLSRLILELKYYHLAFSRISFLKLKLAFFLAGAPQ